MGTFFSFQDSTITSDYHQQKKKNRVQGILYSSHSIQNYSCLQLYTHHLYQLLMKFTLPEAQLSMSWKPHLQRGIWIFKPQDFKSKVKVYILRRIQITQLWSHIQIATSFLKQRDKIVVTGSATSAIKCCYTCMSSSP